MDNLLKTSLMTVVLAAASTAAALDQTIPEIVERKANGWWSSAIHKAGTNGGERVYRPYVIGETIDWTWPDVKTVGPGAKLVCLDAPAAKVTNKIYVVKLDLTTPGLNCIGSIRCDIWGENMPADDVDNVAKAYTVREKTEDFMMRSRASGNRLARHRPVFLACNSAAWGPWNTSKDQASTYANPNSPLYSLGVQISASGTGYGTHSTSSDQRGIFVFYKDRTADFIPQMTKEIAKKVWLSLPCFVHRLLVDGQDSGTVASDKSHAQRTSIGLSQDRKTLYLVCCDGRAPNWGDGLNFEELAHVHRAAGSWNAMNLDGGGSTTLETWDASLGKPYMHNWQSGTRRNGSNLGFYICPPQVKAGDYLYDDLESALKDVQAGNLPTGVTELDVIADVSFTADYPGFPEGVSVTLSSTNGSTLGWAEGVEPTVPASARVTLKGVRLRNDVKTLVVAAGGSVTVDGSLGLQGVRTADGDGFVLGGPLGDVLIVDCATARTEGTVFGRSALSLAATRRELAKLVSATSPELFAVAVETANGVELRWGRAADWFSADLTAGTVSGGRWTSTDETNRVFAADRGADRMVRCTTRAAFAGIGDARRLEAKLGEFAAAGSYPQGAVTVAEDGEGGIAWWGLVKEDGQAVWKRLAGAVALKTDYTIVMDVDFMTGAPRVRYVVCPADGAAYPLTDAAGRCWFDGAGDGLSAEGTVKLSGTGTVTSVSGHVLNVRKGTVILFF